ncbi:S9 family peptidase [Methylacidiphilum kamchatkense]|uniref:Dipeptidyl aminopeptidase/acylaminoacyl peptidase n=1 Tax=Methylacidiphilum kamchatkense Kam1 TaxID=1202785 RepID=A0A516TNW4_9BACT|nr:S9 family peptidase [Methylacidiphilum kamchatkense]QDQ42931.1 dipeptidyl aminopeptidase/acylaminoacyl peptidase [Methylacidiphilum kamchatkense Kam1]
MKLLRALFLIFPFFLAPSLLLGTDSSLIPLPVLFSEPEAAAPKISPDGEKLAYLFPENGVRNVRVRLLGTKNEWTITHLEKRGIRHFFWHPDSNSIFYLEDQKGNENFHLFQVGLDGKNPTDLTPFENAKVQVIAVEPSNKKFMLLAINTRNPKYFDVYKLIFATKKLELIEENPGNIIDWVADHNFEIRAAQALMPNGIGVINVRETVSSPWKPLLQWQLEEDNVKIVDFSPDNKSLWLLSSKEANTTRLISMDIASAQRKVLCEDPRYDVAGIVSNPKTYSLEAVAIIKDKTQWQFFDPQMEHYFAYLKTIHPGTIEIISRNYEDTVWTIRFTSDIDPGTYYLFYPKQTKAEFLFHTNSRLLSYQLAPVKPIAFRARDNLLIEGYLTLPRENAKNLPFVLYVHGGPWTRDYWEFSPVVQFLANRGYGVLQFNFRGSTGYGKDFYNAGNKQWGKKMLDDILDAKKWVIEQHYANPHKVAIMGFSYGGYATLAALAFYPDEFACGIEAMGPSNLFTLFNSFPPYWEPLKILIKKRLGDPQTDSEYFKSSSPLFAADRIKAPLLIGQGENDVRVKKMESDQIVEALRKKGQTVEYLLFHDQGHDFLNPVNRLQFFEAVEAFLNKYLGK